MTAPVWGGLFHKFAQAELASLVGLTQALARSKIMLVYPAQLSKVGAGYMVSFRDIPEALTEGRTKAEAMEMAADALATAMDFYFDDRREVPVPSKTKKDEIPVAIPTSLSAKILLLNEMLREGVSPASLARKLKATPQTVTRIVDLHHSTKIDTIDAALGVMGKKLVLTVANA